MNAFLANFHFLRPLWLLALFPALALFAVLWLVRLRKSGWDLEINRALLPHLLDATAGPHRRRYLGLLLAAWVFATFGLAGPAWQRLPEPVQQKEDGLVIIQDLSLSFYAQDLTPDRLTRSRHKLIDILESRREGLTALIVYAGDAHVVTPLTEDTNTISAMVDDLEPGIMPSYGSNLKSAVALALKLFRDGGLDRGKILLLTDGVSGDQAASVSDLLRGHPFTLSIIGVGTSDGAPIPKGDGGFLKDDRGRIVVPRLDRKSLADLAAANGGRYSDIRIDDGDFRELLAGRTALPRDGDYRQTKRQFDQWQDQGYWLAVVLMPLGLIAFRRGWLLTVLFLVLTLVPAGNSYALGWRDLWLRRDQQAAQALAAGNPKAAAGLFKSQPWQGAAQYRAGNFAEAASVFAGSDSADSNYDRGNALARAGKLAEAVKAYDRALKLDPGMTDATANRKLVEKLLQKQKEQQQGQRSGDKGQKGNEGGKRHKQGRKAGENGQDKDRKSPNQPGKSASNRQGQQGQKGEQGREENKEQAAKADSQKGDRSQDKEASARRKQTDRHTKGGLAQQSQTGKVAGNQNKKAGAASEDDRLSPEQRQALAQWLRQIPDDPGGLLRRKFEYQSHLNKEQGGENDGQSW